MARRGLWPHLGRLLGISLPTNWLWRESGLTSDARLLFSPLVWTACFSVSQEQATLRNAWGSAHWQTRLTRAERKSWGVTPHPPTVFNL